MTDAVAAPLLAWLTLAVAAGGLVVAAVSAYFSIHAMWRSQHNAGAIEGVGQQVSRIEVTIDGRLSEWMRSQRETSDLRADKAFSAGQDAPRPADPVLTQAIAVEAVKAATDART